MIGNDWDKVLKEEFQKDYYKDLQKKLLEERTHFNIFPPKEDVFTALELTSFKKTKVVILGQDPYHSRGQAHGLSFSVKDPSFKIPPSLKNIYKEMKSDLGLDPPDHANLTSWASQGVLMLNSILTVREKEPASHRKLGWDIFTDKIIETLNDEKENLVFILWGNDAKKKAAKVDHEKHLVLSSGHPSPFSVKKFMGCRHFSKTNEFLKQNELKEIHWEL